MLRQTDSREDLPVLSIFVSKFCSNYILAIDSICNFIIRLYMEARDQQFLHLIDCNVAWL